MTTIDWNNIKRPAASANTAPKLPAGAYICKIVDAQISENDIGIKIKFNIDIAKGEFAGHFQDYFDKKGEWNFNAVFTRYMIKEDVIDVYTKPFDDFLKILETCNPTYEHIPGNNTNQYKNLYCGFTFGEEEYKDKFGAIRTAVRVKFPCSIKAIREGKAKPPEPKKYHEDIQEKLTNMPDIPDEDLPFL